MYNQDIFSKELYKQMFAYNISYSQITQPSFE